MKIGISLPVRELKDDLGAIREFAQTAEALGLDHLRIIHAHARAAGRAPGDIGMEAGVAVVGPRAPEWLSRVANWRAAGLTQLCLRTLGGDLGADAGAHIARMRQAAARARE